MDRRVFNAALAGAALAGWQGSLHGQPPAGTGAGGAGPWHKLEQEAGGRLGVAVLDTADGRLRGHRLDERFPMCSTFKWLLAAAVLQRVDEGRERLDRPVRVTREDLIPHAPVTGPRAGGEPLTVAELCEAAVTLSDNPASNLLLRTLGGPEGLTRYARALGDNVTRLDRWEPELNESLPGDVRDTTTPRAMAASLQAAVLGDALAPGSRARLTAWLRGCRTNAKRLGAALPAGWTVGSKTGTGARGSTNDVGVFWPPDDRPPIVVVAYLTQTTAPEDARNAVIARVAHKVTTAAPGPGPAAAP